MDTNLKQITTGPKYIPVINSLRGLASLMVCLVHIACMPLDLLDRNGLLYHIFGYGYLGVTIFFVITGVVIPVALINGNYTYSQFGQFMLKRIARIEPPYLVSIALFLIFIALKVHFKHIPNTVTIKGILLHLGYLIPFVPGKSQWMNPVFWTLAVEFQFYILISLIFPLLTHKNLIIRILVYILMLGSALYYPNSEFALSWLPVFIIGIIYINWNYKKVYTAEFWSVIVVAIGITFYLHKLAPTLVAVSTLFVIHFFSQYKNKIGNFLGDISYSLYLVHLIFPIAIVNILSERVTNFYLKLGVIASGILISIAFAYVFYLLVEKPSKKLSSSIGAAHKAKQASTLVH